MGLDGWALGLLVGLLGGAVVALLFRLVIGKGRAQRLTAQLEQTAQALEEIIETAPAGFIVFESQGRLVRMNPSMADLVGLDATEQIGRTAAEVFGEDAGREIDGAIDAVCRTGRAVSNRRLVRVLPTTMEQRTLLVSYYPVVLEEFTLVGGVVVDITERERYNRARERLLDSESAAREGAERAASRLSRLQRITSALSTASSSELVAEVIMAEGMKALEVDAASIATIKQDLRTLRIVASDGFDPAVLRGYQEFSIDARLPIADAARTQRGVYLESLDELAHAYPNLLPDAGESSRSSWAAIPLVVSGRTLGAIGAAFTDGRPFDPERIAFFEAVADQCAAALDRALTYDETRVLAHTLQRSLLPPALPSIDGIEIAARFESAGMGEVSGDFYDAFEVPRGGAWCVSVGDVCGKGARAAAMTSRARYTIRAAAQHNERPSAVLTELDDALRRDDEQRDDAGESFCTAVLATLRPAVSGLHVEVACGGHPLPLVVRRDGSVAECGVPGTVLGAFSRSELALTDCRIELEPGDALVLYTDGLPDAYGPEGFFGDTRLRHAASAGGASAQALVDAVVDEAMAFSRGVLRDDLAVFVVRSPERVWGSV